MKKHSVNIEKTTLHEKTEEGMIKSISTPLDFEEWILKSTRVLFDKGETFSLTSLTNKKVMFFYFKTKKASYAYQKLQGMNFSSKK